VAAATELIRTTVTASRSEHAEDPAVKRATLFVVPVSRFEQI
jgi:hypothetical protein